MLSKIKSFGLQGIKGVAVEVEVDINSGLPSIEMVGLPDTAIKESKERIRSAIKNSGYKFSPNKITINLAPADVKKEGAIYDLPISIGILVATGQVVLGAFGDVCMMGELALDGSLRHVKGVLKNRKERYNIFISNLMCMRVLFHGQRCAEHLCYFVISSGQSHRPLCRTGRADSLCVVGGIINCKSIPELSR